MTFSPMSDRIRYAVKVIMKSSPPTPPLLPTSPPQQDPSQRLSLAVKKLDLLINRAHKLGKVTERLFHNDQTGPHTPSPETEPTPSASSDSTITVSQPRRGT